MDLSFGPEGVQTKANLSEVKKLLGPTCRGLQEVSGDLRRGVMEGP